MYEVCSSNLTSKLEFQLEGVVYENPLVGGVERLDFCLSSPMKLPEYYSGFSSALANILRMKVWC